MATVQKGFFQSDLTDSFFRNVAKSLDLQLVKWSSAELSQSQQVSTAIGGALDTGEKLKGFYAFDVCGRNKDGREKEVKVIMKVMKTSRETWTSWSGLLKQFGEEDYEVLKEIWPFGFSILRCSEIEILAARLAQKDTNMERIRPKTYHTVYDVDRDILVLVMEYIHPEEVLVGGGITHVGWDDRNLCAVLRELAKFHAHFMEPTSDIEGDFNGALERHPGPHLKALPLWEKLAKIFEEVFSKWYTDELEELRQIISWYFENLESITEEEEVYPMTLVHNDTHSGNLWVRKQPSQDQSDLILYDWEAVCIHVPQRDVVFFLLTSMPPFDLSTELFGKWSELTEFYRNELSSALYGKNKELAEKFNDKEAFNRIMGYQVLEAFCNRFGLLALMPEPFRGFVDEILIKKGIRMIINAVKILKVCQA